MTECPQKLGDVTVARILGKENAMPNQYAAYLSYFMDSTQCFVY
jgi:hypothetical protein